MLVAIIVLVASIAVVIQQAASTSSSSSSSLPTDLSLSLERSAIQYDFGEHRDRCTSIGVGRLATSDGSTITTHNNDCQECDFRITHIPAKDWPAGSKRPVYDIRAAYPRYLHTDDSSNIHGPDYVTVDRSIYNWNVSQPIYYIDQVSHTYAYTLGLYGIQNEKQVSFGESTCSSVFVGHPITAGGKAVMHMETLTEIALERCDSARCAIKLMGELGERYGFYGPEADGPLDVAQDESGEALTVSDKEETWMFHIMPDDTGSSAIWVAQRVPDDHITAVANQWVIQEIDLADTHNFIGSSNILSIAERHGLWSAASKVKFNWARVYGTNRHLGAHGCTRRVWRVLTLAAPSLLSIFSPYTDGLASFGYGEDFSQPYPFSVKVDRPLSVIDVMNMNRDQYEGSEFDLTTSVDGGPFGDPMRYPPRGLLKDPVNGINRDENAKAVGFQRAISIWRTAYSTVTQSRNGLPDAVGAVTWIAQYAPHFSSFVPVYASVDKTPTSLNVGTQYKLDRNANWWVHCVTGNYLSRWYSFAIDDVRQLQKSLENWMVSRQVESEQKAVKALTAAATPTAISEALRSTIGTFHEEASVHVLSTWWSFFDDMVGKYRDIYKVVNPHAENFINSVQYLTVPKWWLEQVGFWGAPGSPPPDLSTPSPVHPLNVPSYDSIADYKRIYGYYENRMNEIPYSWPYSCPISDNTAAGGGGGGSGGDRNNKNDNDNKNTAHSNGGSSSSSSSKDCGDVNSSSSANGSAWMYSIVGAIVGAALMYVKEAYVNRNSRPYLPIN